MEILKNYINKNRHLMLLIFWPILLIIFYLCEKTLEPRYYFKSILDDYIPFTKWFIIPYVLWYLYLGASFLYLLIKSKKDFINLCVFLFSGVAICYLIYGLFPNAQNLRPVITETDFLSQIIKLLYTFDTPTNVLPSMHVFDSLAAHICLARYLKPNNQKLLYAVSLLLMISSSISTVFIKQHSILDLFAGLALAILIYFPVFKLSDFISDNQFFNSTT